MWTFLTTVALGLSFSSQILSVTSSKHISRQEQCESAPNDAAYAACAMEAAFGGSALVPELLPDFSPKAALSVKYGNVVLGGAQQLSPSRVFAEPALSMSFISNSSQVYQKSYAVMGLSYQAPRTVKLFWLQSALKVDSNTGAVSSASAPIVKYISPNPSSGTGTNEYVFFVFQDPGLEAMTKQNPQWAAMNIAALDVTNFRSTIAPGVIAGSFFKSSFDGVAINGQTPAALAAAQGQQVAPASKVTAASQNVSTNATAPIPVNNNATTPASTPVASIKATTANDPTTVPTQILRPAASSTDAPSNQTNTTTTTASSAPSVIHEISFKSLFAVVLFSVSFW